MFFDYYTPHRSKPDFTDKPRRVLYITYDRAAEGDQCSAYVQDKRQSFLPDCEREIGKDYTFEV